MSGYPIPAVINPPNRVCVQFEIPDTTEYRRAAYAVITQLSKWYNWQNEMPYDPRQNEVASVMAKMILETFQIVDDCNGGMTMFELRQNSSNPCLLEQSTDGGQTWTLAFDYALCQAPLGSEINIETTITNIENTTNEYNNDPAGFEPQIDGTSFADTAICYALEILIRTALEVTIQRREGENRQNILIQAAAGVVATIGAFIFGTPAAGLATALAVAVGLVTTSLIQARDLQRLKDLRDDDDAIQELVCCAYDALSGTRPIPSAFESAWDNCVGLSVNANEFLPVLQVIAEDIDAFVQFMSSAGLAYTYAENGILGNECLNCPDAWSFSRGNGSGNANVTIESFTGQVDPPGSPCTGTWDALNERWDGCDNGEFSPGLYVQSVKVRIDFGVNVTLNRVELTGRTESSRSNENNAMLFFETLDQNEVSYGLQFESGVQQSFVWTGTQMNVRYLDVYARSYDDAQISTLIAWIQSITVFGDGVPPAWL